MVILMNKTLVSANSAHNLNEITEEYSNRGSFVDISVQDKDDASTCSLVTGSRGVDKVAIHVGFIPESVQIYDFLANLGIKSSTNGEQDLGGVIAIPGHPVIHIKWRESLVPNGASRYKLRMEFNPSDFRRNTLLAPCPFDELAQVCREAIEMVIQYGDPDAKPDFLLDEESGELFDNWPSNWSSKILCTRLDLTQDFYVDDPRFRLSQLKYRRPAYARGTTNHINGKRINTVTHVGSEKYARMKIYDKYNEHKKRSKKNDEDRRRGVKLRPGHIRYEVSLKYKDMKDCDLLSLAKCKSGRLLKVLKAQWSKSTYGEPLFSDEHFMNSLLHIGVSLGDATAIFYYLHCRDTNQDFLPIPDRALRELRKTMKMAGVRVSDGLTQANYSYGHLSFTQQAFVVTSPIVQPFN
jgi:hypothetical protein